MAKLLADKDIERLIGVAIINAKPERLNPNGIELCLGKSVHFLSTGEEMDLAPGMYLKVSPGETVTITSMESLDFTSAAVKKIFPGHMLMGLITPTTTMMREGISQVTTKVDAGFKGMLNWSLHNGAPKDLILRYGEPIFKLTIFLLETDESPQIPYGERPTDSYQDATGIVRSTRTIPADIPKAKLVSSSFHKLDPKKQLREAGYPFDHIGTELMALDGRIEVVSTDLRAIKDEFRKTTAELAGKIEKETSSLVKQIETQGSHLFEKVESLFNTKFIWAVSVVIGGVSIMYGVLSYLEKSSVGGKTLSVLSVLVGIIVILVSIVLTSKWRTK